MADSGYIRSTAAFGYVQLEWEVYAYNILENYTQVKYKLYVQRNTGEFSSSTPQAYSINFNGSVVASGSVSLLGSGTKSVKTGYVNIPHNSDGTKTFAYSFSQAIGVGGYSTQTASGTGTLPTIERKSTLTISRASTSLGAKNTLTITRKHSSFAHTITWKCGTASGTICTNSTSTSIVHYTEKALAEQNKAGTSVSITYTILTTYPDKSISVGSNSTTLEYAIPSDVVPSCSVSVEDATGYFAQFGAFIQGYSKLNITVAPTLAYGSAIASYAITADGSSYSRTSASLTTGALKNSGTLAIIAKVTDKRGRTSNPAETTIVSKAYSVPQITELKVHRCDATGKEDISGTYGRVDFGGSITSIIVGGVEKNSAIFTLEYKKASDTEFTAVVLNSATIERGYYNFEAAEDSSYNVRLTVADQIDETYATAVLSTAGVMMHWGTNGRSLALGKIVEKNVEGVDCDTDGNPLDFLDIGYKTRLQGGILPIVLQQGTDLNTVLTPNNYIGKEIADYGYSNCPIESGTFSLEVLGGGEGQIIQRLTYCSKTDMKTLERAYYQNSWGDWICTKSVGGVLWDGSTLSGSGYVMTSSETITLAEKVSEQKTGIVLVFKAGTDYNYDFIPKIALAGQTKITHTSIVATVYLSYMGTKVLSIYDDKIAGSASNNLTGSADSGITYNNNVFKLYRVLGV